jgi:hypothetical protein
MVVFEAPEMPELPQFVAILMVFLDAQNWIWSDRWTDKPRCWPTRSLRWDAKKGPTWGEATLPSGNQQGLTMV